MTCMVCGSRVCALRVALSRALPPGLAEGPDLRHSRALHQGCTIELRSVSSPSWRSCHTRSCRQALSRHQQATRVEWRAVLSYLMVLSKSARAALGKGKSVSCPLGYGFLVWGCPDLQRAEGRSAPGTAACSALKHTTHSMSVGQGRLFCDGQRHESEVMSVPRHDHFVVSQHQAGV